MLRRELKLTLPVIAMTAGVLASERNRCVEAGITDFIPKPVVVEEMMAVILRNLPGAQGGAGADSAPAQPGQAAPADGGNAGAMPPSPAAAEDIPLFSMDGLMRVMGKDPKGREVMFRMVRNALADGMQPMDAADQALREGRGGDAAQVFHSLRGAIGVLGAKRLIGATMAAESAIAEQRTADLPALFASVRSVLQDTLRQATEWLEQEDQ